MAFDLNGDLVYDLRTDDGSYHFVTSVAERDGTVVSSAEPTNPVPCGGRTAGSWVEKRSEETF